MNRLVGLLRAGRTRTKVIGLSVILVLAAGAVAIAAPTGILTPGSGGPQGIVTVGPVNPSNGFPDWYRDTNGVDLAPCIDPQDKFCGGAVAAPDNTAPITFPDNFPDEFFYMSADADSLTSAGGNNVLASYALEGAFANGGPAAGDQIVFTRIRYRINAGLQANTNYKVTHPYGTDTVTSDDTGALFVTQDVGPVPGDFAAAIKGRVGPFLQWAATPGNPADVPPAGYIGDGVTPHAVTGSELGTNFVRIQGPGIGGAAGSTNPNPCNTTGANAYTGPVNDCIQTNNFVLVGKKSTTAGVDVTRATYSKSATSTQIQVLANSKSTQDIVVQDGDNGPGPNRLFSTTPLRPDAGRYMARVDVPGALPQTVDVVNRGDVPTTTKHVNLTDAVTATAVYHVTKGGGDKLHVTASSSDSTLAGSSLTLPEFGDKALDATGQTDIQTPAPPDTVTVKSAKGGSVTVPVAIDGQGLDALPLVANAGPDQSVDQGAKVTLDGGGSAGDIDSVSWSGPEGITLTGADTTKATFTAPTTATTLTFTLTVKSGTQTKTDDVVITVKPTNPARAQIAPVGATVLQNLPLTLDGTTSIGAAKFEWSQVPGDATPVTLGADTTSSKLTFLFPKTTTPIHIQLRVRSAADSGVGCSAPTCDTAVITLTPQLDTLGAIRAKNDGKGRWVVDGTSSVQESNNVRVYAGATIGTSANLIGTALVDPTGSWKVDVRNSTVAVPACRCVSVESDRGGKVLNIPMS